MSSFADVNSGVLHLVVWNIEKQKVDKIATGKPTDVRPKDFGYVMLLGRLEMNPRGFMGAVSHWFIATKTRYCATIVKYLIDNEVLRPYAPLDAFHPHFPLEVVYQIRNTLENVQKQCMVDEETVETCLEYDETLWELVRDLSRSEERRSLMTQSHAQVYDEICYAFRKLFVDGPMFTESEALVFGFIPVLAVFARNIHYHFRLSQSQGRVEHSTL